MRSRHAIWRSAESRRLAELRRLDILDTPVEARFDEIVRLAADCLDAPIATLTLVDAERQWFKARVGIAGCEGPRVPSFCNRTIGSGEPMIVLDAALDRRFAANPLVTDRDGIRFYAGAPLVSAAGERVGALCVVDTKPRSTFPEVDRALLVTLAGKAIRLMEQRAARNRHDYAWPVAHSG